MVPRIYLVRIQGFFLYNFILTEVWQIYQKGRKHVGVFGPMKTCNSMIKVYVNKILIFINATIAYLIKGDVTS